MGQGKMSPHQTNQNKTISRQASQPAEPLNQGNLVIGWPADRTPISELVRIVHLHSLAAGLTLISHSNIRTQADFSELLLPLRVTFRWYYLDTVKNVKFKKNTGGKTIIKNSKTNYINFKFYKNILKKKLFFVCLLCYHRIKRNHFNVWVWPHQPAHRFTSTLVRSRFAFVVRREIANAPREPDRITISHFNFTAWLWAVSRSGAALQHNSLGSRAHFAFCCSLYAGWLYLHAWLELARGLAPDDVSIDWILICCCIEIFNLLLLFPNCFY